jgi:hypothetical protein
MTGINYVLKRVSEIFDNAKDDKTRMECMKLQMELYKSIMGLATDGGIIQRAVDMMKRMEPKSYAEEAEKILPLNVKNQTTN